MFDGLFSRSSSSQDLKASPSGALVRSSCFEFLVVLTTPAAGPNMSYCMQDAQLEAQREQHTPKQSAPLPGARPNLQTATGLIPKPCRVVDTSFASFSLFTETLYDPYE